MNENGKRDPMVDMFIFETEQLLGQIEELMIESEKDKNLNEYVENIFRNMHTIKGNAAMMSFENISKLAHSVEDLFDYLRKNNLKGIDYSEIMDLVLQSIDFIKDELEKVKEGKELNGNSTKLINKIANYLRGLKGKDKNLKDYKVCIYFKKNCGMENVRAFNVVYQLKNGIQKIVDYIPRDIEENADSEKIIKREGFKIIIESDKTVDEIEKLFENVAFIDKLYINEVSNDEKKENSKFKEESNTSKSGEKVTEKKYFDVHGFLSIDVAKLDELMDLVGELVISESMVTKNPELKGIQLDNFYKSARQLRKIVNNIQDTVMSMRMVPIKNTFAKMNRLVRDMTKKLGKKVQLNIIGENTEVDKNIIENIADPLMHLIRNCIDHGIESPEKRKDLGKNEMGIVTLEAKNEGGDVWIIVKDNGRGLDKEKILKKAIENKITDKTKDKLSDKEIFSFILLPGFSTNEKVTEYSGRGVGMDVVMKNIEKLRGNIYIESKKDKGTNISIKIPLTLAIIEGMNIRVGKNRYTIPITSINESFKAKKNEIIIDPENNEMIMLRGKCYQIIRLHELYNIKTHVTNIEDGIIIMVENEGKNICLFADELLGSQQVVVKSLPKYIKQVKGIAGCTLLGDGGISLILDVSKLFVNN